MTTEFEPGQHPLRTVSALRRVLVPGTTLRIVNHRYPQVSRTTVVLPRTNTVDLVTHALDRRTGKDVESHLPWPKRADLHPDETDSRVVHISHDGVKKFLTVTVLECDDPTVGSD